MPKYKLTDAKTGKSYAINAPDPASAMKALQTYTGASQQPANSPDPGLFMPGSQAAPGDAPGMTVTPTPPNEHFGLSASDTLNPLPALSAMGNQIASNVPVLGPYLKSAGENFDAMVDNNIYRPMTGQAGTTTLQDVAQTNARQIGANPEASAIGTTVGKVAPYVAAAEVPLLSQTLGFSGPWLQRAAMTGISQYAINTGDNLAHGQPIEEASKNALAPSIASIPFSILGRGAASATSPARQEAANTLRQEGIQLSAGQQRGSRAMMNAESQLGGAAAQKFRDKQLSQLTQAALKRAGVSADSAAPEVMQKAFSDAGDRFNNLAKLTTVKVDQPLQNGLLKVVTDYTDLTGVPAPFLEKFVNRVGTIAANNGGVLKGENYKVLSTDLTEAIKSAGDPTTKMALSKLKTELDDAVERSMSGQTKAAWQKVRRNYANLKVIQDGVDGAGQFANQGLLTPESLGAALRTGDTTNYVKGWQDLNKLSRAANITMPALPDSGTASRMASYALAGGGIPAAVATHAITGNPGQAALMGAASLGSAVLPGIAGRAMLSGPGRALLTNGTNVPAAVARGTLPTLSDAAMRLIGG